MVGVFMCVSIAWCVVMQLRIVAALGYRIRPVSYTGTVIADHL
jgi:hypothetical protein